MMVGHTSNVKTVGFPDTQERSRSRRAAASRTIAGSHLVSALAEIVGPVEEAIPEQSIPDDPRIMLEQLEALHSASMITPQQPCVALDALIRQAIKGRPEWRQKLAVMTKSPLLRKKILSINPEGGRGSGCNVLGHTHPWRKERLPDSFADHNWPSLSHVKNNGTHMLLGGTEEHRRLLRAPVDQRRIDPTLSHSPSFTLSKSQRFPAALETGEVAKERVQARGTPGPGQYFKSLPRGVAFPEHGGEGMVFGANHICPWKGAMGHNINPVDVDHTVLHAAPKYSFSKTRRAVSEPNLGNGLVQGGPVKTDFGCLSPGHIYESYSAVRPSVRLANAPIGDNRSQSLGGTGTIKSGKRRIVKKVPKVRCIPVDPDPMDVSASGVSPLPDGEVTMMVVTS